MPVTSIPSHVASGTLGPTVSDTPTTNPSGNSSVCLVTVDDSSDYCVQLVTSDQLVVGNICVRPSDVTDKLDVFIQSTGVWSLIEVKLWAGYDLEPPEDPHQFPYYWCESSGDSTWNVSIDFEYNQSCKSSRTIPLVGVLNIGVARSFRNGTVISSTKENALVEGDLSSLSEGLSYFKTEMDCQCRNSVTTPPSKPPGMCIQNPASIPERCFVLEIDDEVSVGQICVRETVRNAIEVVFYSTKPYALREIKLWIGLGLEGTPGRGEEHGFPYFWNNASGVEFWKVLVEVADFAQCGDFQKLFGQSWVKVGRTMSNGSLIENTEEVAWVKSADSNPSEGGHNVRGSFYFSVYQSCSTPFSDDTKSMASSTELTLPEGQMPSQTDPVCYSLLSEQQVEVGTACLNIVGDPPHLEMSFTAVGVWRLLSTKIWLGLPSITPPGPDQVAEAGAFPYYWCDAAGQDDWHVKIPINETENCLGKQTVKLRMSAHAVVARAFANATLIQNTRETASVYDTINESHKGWLDFVVICGMPSQPNYGVKPAQPPSCLDTQDSTGKICYSLETMQGTNTGAICVEMAEDYFALQVTYTSAVSWSMTKAKFWIGPAPTRMPEGGNNLPHIESFPYFWSNSSGQTRWKTKVDLDLDNACERGGLLKFYAFAQTTVARVTRNGTPIPQSLQSAYATSFSGYGQHQHGLFEIPVRCQCQDTDQYSIHAPVQMSRNSGALARADAKTGATAEEENVCFSSPEGSLLKCFTLLVAGRAAGGSVCLEIQDKLPYLAITFKAISKVWALIRNAVWIGLSSDDVPQIHSDDAIPQGFQKIRYNSSGDNTWTTYLPLNVTDNCAGQSQFEMVFLAHSIVGRIHGNGTLMKSPRHSAFAVGPPTHNSDARHDISLSVKCNCELSKSRRLRELEIFPQAIQNFLY